MTMFKNMGSSIRELSKNLVMEYMKATQDCKPGQEGKRQAIIF